MSDSTVTPDPNVQTQPATVPATTPVQTQVAKPVHPQKGKPRGPEIRIPQAAFNQRVSRAAAQIVKTRLGVTIEEAEATIKKGAAAGVPGANSGNADTVANAAMDQLRREKAAAEAKANKAVKDRTDLEAKHKKDLQRLKDKQIASELKYIASSVGIKDTEYAIYLFARHAAANNGADPNKFFAGLKNSNPYLFVAPTVPEAKVEEPAAEEVVATTAPPESAEAGEKKPAPDKAGSEAGRAASIDDMDQKSFSTHMKSKYGYTPGM